PFAVGVLYELKLRVVDLHRANRDAPVAEKSYGVDVCSDLVCIEKPPVTKPWIFGDLHAAESESRPVRKAKLDCRDGHFAAEIIREPRFHRGLQRIQRKNGGRCRCKDYEQNDEKKSADEPASKSSHADLYPSWPATYSEMLAAYRDCAQGNAGRRDAETRGG